MIKFTIPGKPEGKGRPRFRRAGNYVQTYTPDKTVVYENWVKDCFRNAGGGKMNGEIHARITAYFPIPKSATKKRRAAMESGETGCATKPDTDNLAKCVLDALNGMAYDDDSAVTWLEVRKLYSNEPRCEVQLIEKAEKENEQ